MGKLGVYYALIVQLVFEPKGWPSSKWLLRRVLCRFSIPSPSHHFPSYFRSTVCFVMASLIRSALAAALLAPGVLGAHLYVSHFSGEVYSLTFAEDGSGNGTLSVDASTSGCGSLPSWLTLDRTSGSLYCFDESWYGSGVVSSFDVSSSSGARSTGSAKTAGNTVHGWLYGGTNGNSFVSTAE